MPNATIPAVATGLPSRRRALTALVGIGAGLSLPRAGHAAVAAGHPDAALIVHAAMVEEMAARCNATLSRICDLTNEVERLHPIASRPRQPKPISTVDIDVQHYPDGSRVLRSTPKLADPAAQLVFARQVAAFDAWEAERNATCERLGVDSAEALHSDLYAALQDVVGDLLPMGPTTLAGLTAKARVAVLLDPHGDLSFNDWEVALMASVAADAVRIGGAA